MDSSHYQLPPLPPYRSAQEVYADFLGYLLKCTRSYIEDTHSNGALLWTSLQGRVDFVVSHPNGWEGAQQSVIQKAFVMSGLVPNTPEGHARLQFITEGEASLNFCLQKGLTSTAMQSGEGVIIVDAGGGTVDISAYHVALRNHKVKEIAPSQCLFQGSVFVTRRAEVFFETEFSDSEFSEDVPSMVQTFDHGAKLTFRGSSTPSYVKFGTLRDNNRALNVRNGMVVVPGTRVEGFFKPSFQAIMDAITLIRKEASERISTLYLVGGFAANEWLFRSLQDALNLVGIAANRPDSHMNKAVADGSVSFYLDRFVKTRVARLTYGVECHLRYEHSDPEHRVRRGSLFRDVDGEERISGGFDVILARGTSVTEDTEFRRPYTRLANTEALIQSPAYRCLDGDILAFHGSTAAPGWLDMMHGEVRTVCTITGHAGKLPWTRQYSPGHGPYFKVEYETIITFGPADMKAQNCWIQNGQEVRSPASIVYSE